MMENFRRSEAGRGVLTAPGTGVITAFLPPPQLVSSVGAVRTPRPTSVGSRRRSLYLETQMNLFMV
jgi:hypothetical protein